MTTNMSEQRGRPRAAWKGIDDSPRGRRLCPECGNKVRFDGKGRLYPHYRGPGGRLRVDNEKRCPGGVIPPKGDVRVIEQPTPDRTGYRTAAPTEGELSIRPLRGGLPG